MQELQVPTQRLLVEVFTSGGERFRGGLFITESPFHTGPVDQVLQTLNDERGFLPFRTEGEKPTVAILNKCHILRVRFEGGHDDDPPFPANDVTPCNLLLADGTRLEGELTVETPRTLSRLVDKLNRAERFVRFATGEAVEFVQTALVVRVD